MKTKKCPRKKAITNIATWEYSRFSYAKARQVIYIFNEFTQETSYLQNGNLAEYPKL